MFQALADGSHTRLTRHRPRFSLRTLLVVVTVLSGLSAWMAWQIQIVRTREAMLSELNANGAKTFDRFDSTFIQPGWGLKGVRGGDPSKKPSWLRKAIGDFPVSNIYFEKADQDAMRRSSYFPEAAVFEKWKVPVEMPTNATSSDDDLFADELNGPNP
jgi:hypothetical protein